eukprot:7916957-Pyramimonas_sp.AAC.1
MFNLMEGRLFHPKELFLAMGIPIPTMVDDQELADLFVIDIIDSMSNRALTKLVGNGMALPAVGSVLLFIIVSSVSNYSESEAEVAS